MKRELRVVLVAVCLAALAAPCGVRAWLEIPKGSKVWESPSGRWRLVGPKAQPVDEIVQLMENRPPDDTGHKFFEIVWREPGMYVTFGIDLKDGQKLVWTRNTKIVLIDKSGRTYESEGCFFVSDQKQTVLFDCRRTNVVIAKGTVWCGAKGRAPCVAAKYAVDCIPLKEIVAIDVVGAVEVPVGGEVE